MGNVAEASAARKLIVCMYLCMNLKVLLSTFGEKLLE